jgi:Kef-type K+ transport system membrane component KefB
MMFSSTIIGIKLLPTTVLHHRHIGEMMVGLLLLQDLIAIICLVLIMASGGGGEEQAALRLGLVLLSLPLLAAAAWARGALRAAAADPAL